MFYEFQDVTYILVKMVKMELISKFKVQNSHVKSFLTIIVGDG